MTSPTHVRNFVFGVEDSLVSTVGLLSGVAVGGMSGTAIILTGAVLIFVEAFSMAVGSFLSEQSAREFQSQRDLPISRSLAPSITMFFSYFVSGFLPLAPYLVLDTAMALYVSIGVSLLALFVLGAFGSSISRVNPLKGGAQMAGIGGIAIAVGILIGKLFVS